MNIIDSRITAELKRCRSESAAFDPTRKQDTFKDLTRDINFTQDFDQSVQSESNSDELSSDSEIDEPVQLQRSTGLDDPHWDSLSMDEKLINLNEKIYGIQELLITAKNQKEESTRDFICSRQEKVFGRVAKAFTDFRTYFRTLDRSVISTLWASLQNSYKSVEIFITVYCMIASPFDGTQHQSVLEKYKMGHHMSPA